MCAFFSVIVPLNLLSLLAEMFCKGLHQGRFGKVTGQNLSRPALVLVVDVSSSLFDFLKILLINVQNGRISWQHSTDSSACFLKTGLLRISTKSFNSRPSV